MPGKKKQPEGLPDPESIVEQKTFVSPKGRIYRILRTTQMDLKDKPRAQRKNKSGGPAPKE